MADAVVPDVSPYVGWLATAHPAVQALAIIVIAILAALVIWRLPSVADAIARVRGKGETDLERELAAQVHSLSEHVAQLDQELRVVKQWRDQHRRMLQAILPRMECLVPGCQQAEFRDALVALIGNDPWAGATASAD